MVSDIVKGPFPADLSWPGMTSAESAWPGTTERHAVRSCGAAKSGDDASLDDMHHTVQMRHGMCGCATVARRWRRGVPWYGWARDGGMVRVSCGVVWWRRWWARTRRGAGVAGWGCVWVWESPGPLSGGAGAFVYVLVRRRATLPHPVGCSTIAVPGLSFRVRNGSGRLPWAMAAASLQFFVVPARGGGGCLGTGWWTRACSCCGVVCSRRFVLMLVLCVFRSVVCPGRWSRRGAGVGRVRPLVPVGSTARAASTSGLSTTCSRVGSHATSRVARNPYLGAGFPLRCFQRLSLPNVANRPCRWRDNRHTRGSSTQVLSYYGQASSGFQRAQRIETKLSHDVLNPARVPL